MPLKYTFLGAIALPAIFLDPASGFKQNSSVSSSESNRTLISQSTSDTATISTFASRVIINEVLYQQTGIGATGNDEFIEIYNPSATSVDISGWKVVDGNLIGASNDGIGSITGRSNNPAYTFPENTILEPGKFAIVWIGSNNSSHQAPKAAFQFWLEQAPKLNNEGDDVWLYDRQSRIVDYIVYGSGTAINTPPPASLNLWDSSYQASLANATKGQSIALATNGVDTNVSACWEATGSKAANDRCKAYSPTIDTDETSDRAASIAQKNTSTPVPTLTPTPTPTPTPSVTLTPTPTPSVTPTPTLTPLPRVTPTSTPTPIPTISPTPTPTSTPTPTPSITPTIAPVNGVNGIIKDPRDAKKVIICHVPPGNAGNPVTLSINLNAIEGHSNHPNDYDGPCRLR